MKTLTDLHRVELNVRSETYDYRTPMKFGGRVVTDVTVVSVDCNAETASSNATGLGSMTMGVAWAWPDPSVGDTEKLDIVVELLSRIAKAYSESGVTGHPLDICHELIPLRESIAKDLATERNLASPIPDLAVLLAASPVEAALFDAHGKAAGQSSYALLSQPHLTHDLAHYLGESAYRDVWLGDLISDKPVSSMPLYHLVGALDPLGDGDLDQPVGDGMPETLRDWIVRDGLTHLKIKLNGDDLDWDVQRVIRTHQVAMSVREKPAAGQADWAFSLDFNEKCADEEYVLAVLERITREQPHALHCIQYIEQPTHRDLERLPAITMHRVRERLPVVIDESLVNLRSLRTAIKQGYSGIALKACKGHAEALLLGAVARHEKLFLCVQDLTCVGASLLHSASLAAHIPGVAAIESNGRQYSPAANQRWMAEFGEFFEVRGGQVPTRMLSGPGLGYGNDPALSQ
ncbi:enolase C-terminal domain-like protein [Novipirellula sp. SH528]|uniref:enolase C-terminal domain-like protein n=1 Tax=Novipirellula sp. SH528 TaxID=3454466 RepID=UPI003FA1887F